MEVDLKCSCGNTAFRGKILDEQYQNLTCTNCGEQMQFVINLSPEFDRRLEA